MKQRIARFGLVITYAIVLLAWGVLESIVGAGAEKSAPARLSNGFIWPRADVVFLDAENGLWVQRACAFGCQREVTVKGATGQLIGIDYRPADGLLYGLDDTGKLYTIDRQGNATLASALTLPFAGDARSLADFNPVADALRLIGANDQNYAVVNNGGNLALTVAQTSLAYAAGDVNFGRNPNVVGGAYTNNVAGAAATIFFGFDYDQDTLITIAPPLVGAGSSNTGGGQLQTVGRLTDFVGRRFDVDATADVDIYTFGGVNRLIGVSGGRVFSVDLDQIRPLAVGQTRRVFVRSIPLAGDGQFIDVAVGTQRRCDH